MFKKFISFIIAVALTLSTSPYAFAATDEAVSAANALHDMGLFNGTGTDANGEPLYDLDSIPTRNQAVTMLVRLLGKENVATSTDWNIPFSDVADWAKPYVGYAYKNGLTAGTSQTTYSGSKNTTANQYLTFVLRALGYKSNTDFDYNKAWEFSDKIGLTNGQYDESTKTFSRGDVAVISYNALSCKLKSSEKTLLEYLQEASKPIATSIRFQDQVGTLDRFALNVGDKAKFSIIPTPLNASLDGLSWEAQSDNIISVDNTGLVTALSPGIGFLWASLPTGAHALATVYVRGRSPAKVLNIRSKMNSVGGVTFTFDLQNNSSKTLKYVMVSWNCYNAVGDPLRDMIDFSSYFSGKVTGPIEPGKTLSNLRNTRPFYNYNFAKKLGFIELVIHYMDGTVEVVTPSFYYDYWDIT